MRVWKKQEIEIPAKSWRFSSFSYYNILKVILEGRTCISFLRNRRFFEVFSTLPTLAWDEKCCIEVERKQSPRKHIFSGYCLNYRFRNMEARNKLARKSVRPNKATFLSYKSFYFKKINQRDETATYTPPTMENISIFLYAIRPEFWQ